MRLPLLCGATPVQCQDGPSVHVKPGVWYIESDGFVDSVMQVHLDGIPHTETLSNNSITSKIELVNSGVIQVKWVNRGNERVINVWLRKAS